MAAVAITRRGAPRPAVVVLFGGVGAHALFRALHAHRFGGCSPAHRRWTACWTVERFGLRNLEKLTHTLFVFVAMQIIGRRRDACGGQHGDFFGPTASDSSRGRRSLQLMTCHGSGATGGFRCLQQGQLEHLHCGSTPRVLGARRKLLLAGRVLGAGRSARRCPGADLFLPGWRGPMSVRGHPSPLCAAR